MTLNVKLAKLQGKKMLQEEERNRLVSLCIITGNTLPPPIDYNPVLSLPQLLRATSAYAKNLVEEIKEKEY